MYQEQLVYLATLMRPGENVACMQFVLLSKYRKMAIQDADDDVGQHGHRILN